MTAIDQIKLVKAEYFRTLDAKLWDAFALLFTPDCEFITYRDVANTESRPRRGRDEIVSSLRRRIGDATTVHNGHALKIELQSRDRATAIWEMTDYAEIPNGTSMRILRGAGRYYETYRLVGEQWMISYLELRRTHLTIE